MSNKVLPVTWLSNRTHALCFFFFVGMIIFNAFNKVMAFHNVQIQKLTITKRFVGVLPSSHSFSDKYSSFVLDSTKKDLRCKKSMPTYFKDASSTTLTRFVSRLNDTTNKNKNNDKNENLNTLKQGFLMTMVYSLFLFFPYSFDVKTLGIDMHLKVVSTYNKNIDRDADHLSIQENIYKPYLPAPLLLKAFAGYGDPPKQSYFVPEVDPKSSIDSGIYNEKENIEEKKIKVEKEWKNMLRKVLVAIKKGNKADAQTVLANNMTTLKNDMRLVAKVACDGDILERNNPADPKSEAKFDYNTGKFSYKPIAAKAELIFDQINDVYFYNFGTYVKTIDKEGTIKTMEQIDADFEAWLNMIEK